MNRLRLVWQSLSSNFWFTPGIFVAGSIALAVGLIEAESLVSQQGLAQWPRVFGAGAAGARGMLSTIAASMMTVVGVTYSMILVTLSLAASQYTPRILRNFMANRVMQVSLGMFAGIFAYCLIVLRTIRGGDEGAFVPHLALAVSFLMALAGVVTLILFIHHVATLIQSNSIIASVAAETREAIKHQFPDELGVNEAEDPPVSLARPGAWTAVRADRSGFVQFVDHERLLRLASELQRNLRLEREVGEFVVREEVLLSAASSEDQELADDKARRLRSCFNIGRYRTVSQDPAFGIQQLVDIALKALSPGINDTTTAVTCVQYLTEVLAEAAQRRTTERRLADTDGPPGVLRKGPTFSGLLNTALDPIYVNAAGNAIILAALIRSLATLAQFTPATRLPLLEAKAAGLRAIVAETVALQHSREPLQQLLAEAEVTLARQG